MRAAPPPGAGTSSWWFVGLPASWQGQGSPLGVMVAAFLIWFVIEILSVESLPGITIGQSQYRTENSPEAVLPTAHTQWAQGLPMSSCSCALAHNGIQDGMHEVRSLVCPG